MQGTEHHFCSLVVSSPDKLAGTGIYLIICNSGYLYVKEGEIHIAKKENKQKGRLKSKVQFGIKIKKMMERRNE